METFRQIMRVAVEAGASDIHLKENSPVLFRVRRDLRKVEAPLPTAEWLGKVLAEIVPARLRDRLATEREADFAITLQDTGRFRANVYQQRGKYVLALRVVRTTMRTFDELRLPPAIRRLVEIPHGIVLITGAPGSGKSTTLAALIEEMNQTTSRHIITLEDPIEFSFQDKLCCIEQREIGIDTSSFKSGLRNVLRQDPDVLVIGEMRDAESMAAALSAANVGCLAIATLHTSDVPRSIRRILEFFPGTERDQARRQLAATVRAIVCQKLTRAIAGDVVPAVEMMFSNAGIAKIIETDQLDKIHGAIELGSGEGMQTFDQALHHLASTGVISYAEALSQSPNPETFRMKMQGMEMSESRRILNARD